MPYAILHACLSSHTVSSMSASNGPREWDAGTYHAVATPHQGWGAEILDRLALRGDETVLDLGCGTGRVSAQLLERLGPEGHVIGVDGSAAMVAEAQRRAGRRAGAFRPAGPARADRRRARRRRRLQRHLPLDRRPRPALRAHPRGPEGRGAVRRAVRRTRERRLDRRGRPRGRGARAVRRDLRGLGRAVELRLPRGDGPAPGARGLRGRARLAQRVAATPTADARVPTHRLARLAPAAVGARAARGLPRRGPGASGSRPRPRLRAAEPRGDRALSATLSRGGGGPAGSPRRSTSPSAPARRRRS